MGQTIEKEKLVLIPPQIKPKRRVPLFRSDFDVLGRAVNELVSDFFPDGDTLQVNLFLKPNLPADAPDVNSFTTVGVSLQPEAGDARVHGGLAVEATVPQTNLRAAAAVKMVENEPNLVISLDHRPTSYFRWFVEGNPQNYFGGGASVNVGNVSAGVYSTSFVRQQSNGESRMNDTATAWISAEASAAMVGARANIRASPQAPHSIENIDFAVALFDPTSAHRDKPAFEIAAIVRDLGKSFSLSYFQHFVLRRKIYNPLEEKHITHIVNYVDVGTKVTVDKVRGNTMGVATSWQLNKNHMFKAKVDNHRATLAWVFRNWTYPSFALSACSKYDFKTKMPSLGATLSIQTSFGGDFENVSADYDSSIVKYQAEKAPEVKSYDRVDKPGSATAPVRAAEPVRPPASAAPQKYSRL